VIGGVLIVIGGLFLARQFVPQIDFDLVWPMILVGLGVVVLAVGLTRDRSDGPGPG
jgi:hypothetical protein